MRFSPSITNTSFTWMCETLIGLSLNPSIVKTTKSIYGIIVILQGAGAVPLLIIVKLSPSNVIG